jgi:hypothetical protein
MPLIEPWARARENLEVLWLAGLFRSSVNGWRVTVYTRGVSSRTVEKWDLPIGLLPILSPGQVFIAGDLASKPATGSISTVRIPNLADGAEIDAGKVPPSLYSFERHQGWGQRLLRYRVNGNDYLIPTVELVRFLFLHNKTMANALMVPSGLMALATPVQPGFQTTVRLEFTQQMPRRCLTAPFVREFSWLAVHPDARRSWDSVRRQTHGQRHVGLSPPAVSNAGITFRGVVWRSMWLVLEILQLAGRSLPCQRLEYSHPAGNRIKYAIDATGIAGASARRNSKPGGAGPNRVINTTAGSRINVHQPAVPIPGKVGVFENNVPVKKIRNRVVRPVRSSPPTASGADERGASAKSSAAGRTKRVSVSVGEAVGSQGLPPIEFQILEPAGWDYLGKLEPLIATIGRIAADHPEFGIIMSLCRLKSGRAFSMVNRQPRVCLVAIFRPPAMPPVVLLDVDHTGIAGLSGLLLRYREPCESVEIEGHIRLVLDALVDRGGKWDADAEADLPAAVACRRLPKVLRRQGKMTRAEHVAIWAERLIRRIGAGE